MKFPFSSETELALALYFHSFKLVQDVGGEMCLDRINECVCCLYAALKFTAIPKHQVTIKVRLASILLTYTNNYQEAEKHLNEGLTLCVEPEEKVVVLDLLCQLYGEFKVENGLFMSIVCHAATFSAKHFSSFKWECHFLLKLISHLTMQREKENFVEALEWMDKVILKSQSDSYFKYFALIYKINILVENNCLSEARTIFLEIVDLENETLQNQSDYYFGLNIYTICTKITLFLEEGDVEGALRIYEQLETFIKSIQDPRKKILKFPHSFVWLNPKQFSIYARWLSFMVKRGDKMDKCIGLLRDIVQLAKDYYVLECKPAVRGWYYQMILNAYSLLAIEHDPVHKNHDLHLLSFKNALLTLKDASSYQPVIEESLLWLLSSRNMCKKEKFSLFIDLTIGMIKMLIDHSSQTPTVDWKKFPSLVPFKLLFDGVSSLRSNKNHAGDAELHKAKYSLFECLKISNGQFLNNHFKLFSLACLGFIYCETDIVQATKILTNAQLLCGKLRFGNLSNLIDRMLHRVLKYANFKEECREISSHLLPKSPD